jgi:ribosomal protein S18 acetylase RimI-like enzyme
VSVRDATHEDVDLLMTLVERLESELPSLPYAENPAEFERGKVERMVDDGIALVAEEDGRAVGYALARYGDHGPKTVYISDLWVDPSARGRRLGRELLRRVAAKAAERDCTHVLLDVDSTNTRAIAFYQRLGFEEGAKIMRAPLDALARLAEERRRESTGAVHVQSDDVNAIERVLGQFMPRLSRGSTFEAIGSGGWTAVRIQPFDGDVLRKLARELSDRFGITVLLALEEEAAVHFVIHDRGRMVDEYLSIPDYYGPLPPGDAIAMRANATVVSRLTGADPGRVRAVARTADPGVELPPPRELYAQIAELLGVTP